MDHIEKYFAKSPDNDLLTPLTINESQRIVSDGDVDTVVANIKKEEFDDEYEDYKLSIPEMCQEETETENKFLVYCPICLETVSCSENSLASHLINVHHRTERNAKIYECKICGKNTFTRSYDLERHRLIHARYADESIEGTTSNVSETSIKTENDSAVQSLLFNIFSQCKPINETLNYSHQNNPTSDNSSVGSARSVRKRKIFVKSFDIKPPEKKMREGVDKNKNQSFKVNIPPFCSICQGTCPRNESLESHMVRVHRRHKQYAKIYECTVCRKNTFTRPYDLRRHELIHLRQASTATVTDSVSAQSTSDKVIIKQKPTSTITKPLMIDETKKKSTDIQTTNPKKNGILCFMCDEKFDSYLDVTMHLKNVHNQKRIYKCRHLDCGDLSFTNSFALHRHEICHLHKIAINNQHRMKCIFCRKSFNKKWNLMNHEKKHLAEQSLQ